LQSGEACFLKFMDEFDDVTVDNLGLAVREDFFKGDYHNELGGEFEFIVYVWTVLLFLVPSSADHISPELRPCMFKSYLLTV
jgi:hypothetical protein